MIFIIMRKKLIITESQFTKLKNFINENEVHTSIVKQMKQELDANYTPTEKYLRKGGDYWSTPMITVKVDGEVISPKSLFEYLSYKYKVSDDFTKQVIQDWMFGHITDDYRLSKNVPIN